MALLQAGDSPNDVRSFDIVSRNGDDVYFNVACSKGTYIRSLAHDFGETLGVGAHLVELRRTHIGAFSVESAWTLDRLEEALA